MNDQTDRYRDNTGRDPVERFPEDHPDRWQWDYAGKPAERNQLLERLGITEQQTQEEALF